MKKLIRLIKKYFAGKDIWKTKMTEPITIRIAEKQ